MAMDLVESHSVVPASTSQQAMPRAVHKQLAMHEALRRLGFRPNEIFATWEDGPKTLIWVAGKKFFISYPHTIFAGSDADYLAEWQKENEIWRRWDDAAQEKLFRSFVSPEVVRLLSMALRAKGFEVHPAN